MRCVGIHECFLTDLHSRMQRIHPDTPLDELATLALYSVIKDLIVECLEASGSVDSVIDSIISTPFPLRMEISLRLMHQLYGGSLEKYQNNYGPQYVDQVFEILDDGVEPVALKYFIEDVAEMRGIPLKEIWQ